MVSLYPFGVKIKHVFLSIVAKTAQKMAKEFILEKSAFSEKCPEWAVYIPLAFHQI